MPKNDKENLKQHKEKYTHNNGSQKDEKKKHSSRQLMSYEIDKTLRKKKHCMRLVNVTMRQYGHSMDIRITEERT